MKLAAFIPVQTHLDLALACQSIGDRSWIARITERLARAKSVARIVVVSRPEWRARLPAISDDTPDLLFTTEDPLAVAAGTMVDCDGAVFCPLSQLFIDPVRLETLAAQPTGHDTVRLLAVLACEPQLSLTGGAFVQVLTRVGLEAALAGIDLVPLPTTRWLTWPEPREMRLRTADDCQWARTVDELMQRKGGEVSDRDFECAIDRHQCVRGPIWDGIGPRPQSILTIRALREPMFSDWIRYLSRFCSASIDVVSSAVLREATERTPGVGRVWTYDGPAFSLTALDANTARQIAGHGYDVSVLPRLEPSGYGYDNILPLAEASAARVSLWVDLFGQSEILTGGMDWWQPSTVHSPFLGAEALEARARASLERLSQRPVPGTLRRERAPLALGA